MVESISLELLSRHYQTRKPGARYRLVVRCCCRTRMEHHSVSPSTRWLTVRCAFCGDAESVDLRLAQDETSRQTRRHQVEQSCQDTSCTHPRCRREFNFSFEAGNPGRIHVVCPACGTIKPMRRAMQLAALF